MKRSFAALLTVLELGAAGCGRVLGADELRFEEPGGLPGCSVPSDCDDADEGAPHTCLDGTCVPLLGELPTPGGLGRPCDRVIGQENLRTTVPPFLFGVLAWEAEGARALAELNYELVVSQFTAEGGFDVGGSTHLPVGVVCEVTSSDDVDRAADHLTDELGVHALLAALPAAELKRTFERTYHEQGRSVFTLSPSLSTPLLSAVDDGGLLWHTSPPAGDLALVYPHLIRRVQAYLERTPSNVTGGTLRLALLSSLRAEHVDVASYIDASLVLNGRSRSELDRASYRRYALGVPESDGGASYVDALIDLFDFRPHVVVAVDDDSFVKNLLWVIEGAWGQVPDGQTPPFYVLSAAQARSAELASALVNFPSLARRVVGVAPVVARKTALYAAYLSDLQSRNTGLAQVDGGERFHDAAYFLLYAAAATSSPEPSGGELASGMRRLLDGTPFPMGEAQLPQVLGELADPSASIALHGTLGPPDFDMATGARRHGQGSVWCVTLEGDGRVLFHDDELTLDASNAGLVGQLACIPEL